MPDDQALPIYVAIIGTDTLLAARPVDWVQLTRACKMAGFDFVAPVTWGEELIASHIGERVSSVRSTMVSSSCPFVVESLRGTPPSTTVLTTVSPPVACARYLRAAFHPRPVHVTYVGACPGAIHAEVDQEYLPEVLFARLAEAGIDMSSLPHHLDAELPVERARYASMPGGAPFPDWIKARAGVRLVEAAPITIDAVAQSFRDEAVLIDIAPSCRCVCARDRWAASRVEPPRSSAPVVTPVVPVTDERPAPQQPAPAVAAPPENVNEKDRRATFAENGLSAGDAETPPEVPSSLTMTREPW